MSTQLTSTPVDFSTDAKYRVAYAEIQTMFAAAGLIQTADTGQVNLTTANANVGGYQIWKINDSLATTYPIFVKINLFFQYSSYYTMQITVGTGSDGAGNISGVVSDLDMITNQQGTANSNVTNYDTRLCVSEGFIGFVWKVGGYFNGSSYSALAAFFISRSVDDTGAITGDKIYIYAPGYTIKTQVLDVLNGAARTSFADSSFCFIPGAVTSSLVGTSVQVYRHFMSTPRVRPVAHMATVLSAEVSYGTTFSFIPVGTTTSHTFMSLGHYVNKPSANVGTGTTDGSGSAFAMLWE